MILNIAVIRLAQFTQTILKHK